MKPEELKVTFQPSGRSVYVLPNTPLLEAAGRAGIILQTPCGGKGTCGKCRVRIASGKGAVCGDATSPVSKRLAAQGFRLACQCLVAGPLVVEIPEESMFESRTRILTGDTGAHGKLDPVIRKLAFSLEPPSKEDARSDQARFRDAVGNVSMPPSILRALPGFLRAHAWTGTAVMAGNRLIGLERGDTRDATFGVAFDIGTTTVVGTLFDLATGKELGVSSAMNPQVPYGDDVVSRILKTRETPGSLEHLQQHILETVNAIISVLTEKAGVLFERVYDIVLAGNSTMQQIFCGFDSSALGEIPFVQVFDEGQTMAAADLGIKANECAQVYVFPQIGGFVGGDTVAGMLAARLDQWDKPVLLVDIGTNGEIVLAHNGELLAASTAAGPAFEGSRISQGMRAAAGAVEKVVIRDDVLLNVIGNARPVGLCGTALIDAAADLLRCGVLDPTGRILPVEELPGNVTEKIRARLENVDGEPGFVLAPTEESASGEAVILRQKDIRELQLATGAIRAGIVILLRRAGLSAEELQTVLLAGAFGNFIRRSNARRIGLLPPIPRERIRFIGNAASLGAKLALLSSEERAYAETLRRKTQHVDLSRDSDFQTEFGMAMMFPEGEPNGSSEG